LENPVEIQNCRTRKIGPNIDNQDVLFWAAFGEYVVSGCSDMPLGKIDTIKLKIAPGTPPGDYDITLAEANYTPPPNSSSACGSYGKGFAGKIRVLP
jgi:hypothetical protein